MVRDSSHIHLLVLRFSSLGDVAMTVPVIRQLLDQNTSLSLTFVSDEKFAPLFYDLPRINFIGVKYRKEHSGIYGLYKLYKKLNQKEKFNAIIDLHDVIRTKILCTYFRLAGKSVYKINKGRDEKKLLTQKNNKQLVQLTSTFERYASVFRNAGFLLELKNDPGRLKKSSVEPGKNKIIGLAPFAKHAEKMYPLYKMEKVVEWISQNDFQLMLFGGGKEEAEILNDWEKRYPNVICNAGKYSFAEELKLISQLDLMISMDSANMHLASLYEVPVISIWGATHPYAGFYGFGQDPSNIIQTDLYCRPCSVFGDKKCFRGDLACLGMITPNMIITKIQTFFS